MAFHPFARSWLAMTGFRLEGRRPQVERYVLIAAPHTSNWDFPHTLAMGAVADLPIHWLGKHTLFRPPFGWLLRRLGGIPVDRRAPHDLVPRLAEFLRSWKGELALVVPPEGTRKKAETWKSGFYHIAVAAGVPIVPGYLDYQRKAGGFGDPFTPSGDIRRDMDALRAFYADKAGRYPELVTTPRLREESQP